jgi:hypothetical protein
VKLIPQQVENFNTEGWLFLAELPELFSAQATGPVSAKQRK